METIIGNKQVSIYKNIFDKTSQYKISVFKALERIKNGTSKISIEKIRGEYDKEKRSYMKQYLPSITFSGVFSSRYDDKILEHSGIICLDFDKTDNFAELKDNFRQDKFTYACWLSPSGNGIKVLIKIADGKKHREHYRALKKKYKNADPACENESRVCYESYDPEIYINENSEIFTEIIKTDIVYEKQINNDEYDIFKKLTIWMASGKKSFQDGERNLFIYKFSCACCKFGISQSNCELFISSEYLSRDSSFTVSEMVKSINSAYKKFNSVFGTVYFENEKALKKETKENINPDIFDETIPPKDIIYGRDVIEDALRIYDKGYESVETTHIPMLDEIFKFKRKELTIFTGIGNYGKSTFLMHLSLIKSYFDKIKWGVFSPETNPPEEFYHDLTEQLLGADCTPSNINRPPREKYLKAYNFVTDHFFYTYPKDFAPTPKYLKERFLELIIKEKISGVIIDPFNNMSNDYNLAGGREDKYLEVVLGDFLNFAQQNNIFLIIIAHPKMLKKDNNGAYPCPDIFDLTGGAMWNNKADNILVYHRPEHHIDAQSPICELHSKKIRRQKIVGKKGTIKFELIRKNRRFYFNGFNPLDKILTQTKIPMAIESQKSEYPVNFSESKNANDKHIWEE